MFKSIKDKFDNPAVRQIMRACVFGGNLHVADSKLEEYQSRATWSMYGWVENDEILGICGFEVHQTNRIDILHIAVAEEARGRGVGTSMLTSLKDLFCLPLKAETDDESAEFYRKVGFETTPFHIGETRRWICILTIPIVPKPIEGLDPSRVVVSYMPRISEEQLWDFYFRNEICESGYGREEAVKHLKNKNDYTVAAFFEDKLVGFIRVCGCGDIKEACLELTLQGDNLKHNNGSLIERDSYEIFKQMGTLLLDELTKQDIDFVSMYIVENLEEEAYESIGMKQNKGHKVFIKDMRPYA